MTTIDLNGTRYPVLYTFGAIRKIRRKVKELGLTFTDSEEEGKEEEHGDSLEILPLQVFYGIEAAYKREKKEINFTFIDIEEMIDDLDFGKAINIIETVANEMTSSLQESKTEKNLNRSRKVKS